MKNRLGALRVTGVQGLIVVSGLALILGVLLGLGEHWPVSALTLICVAVLGFSSASFQNHKLRRRSRRDDLESVRRLRKLQMETPRVAERAVTKIDERVSDVAKSVEEMRELLSRVLSAGHGLAEPGGGEPEIPSKPVETGLSPVTEDSHAKLVEKRTPLPEGPIARPNITAAVILDPFSELAFSYEWRQILLTPADWREQIAASSPDLLFIESAWRGNRGAWRLAMTAKRGISQEFIDLLAVCRERGIPTVFWNKEDPPNYDRFIGAARLFDYVFTVDADKIPDYLRDLGHDRVGLLPFAAQPRIHNPIESGGGRANEVAFAGSYFAERHDQRREQMEYILAPALNHGLEIFSRMQSEDARYQFPEQYRPHIVGSLPYEEMLAAYTRYKVFLNVNTVTESPTMCSRRLFELSAAKTPVISGPAASIPNFFGEDIPVSAEAGETDEILRSLLQHEELRARLGHRAHRRVMNRHTYGSRVDDVLKTIGIDGATTGGLQASVSMVIPTMRPEMLENVLDFVSTQTAKRKELVLVTHGFSLDQAEVRSRLRDLGLESVEFVEASKDLTLGACMNAGVAAASGDYIAKMDDDNYYGPNYLEDLMFAFQYTSAEVVGKWAHYAHLASSGATLLRFPHAENRYSRFVQGGTLLVSRSSAREVGFEDLPRRVDTTFLEKVRAAGGRVYSADRFNYVSRRSADTAGHTWTISDRELLAKKSRLAFYGDPVEHVTV